MAEFTMAIAGHSFAVRSLFDSTRDYCARYLTEDTPEFCLEVFREELAAMQEALRQEALAEGMKVRTFSDPFLERTVLQQTAAQQLLRRDHDLMRQADIQRGNVPDCCYTPVQCGRAAADTDADAALHTEKAAPQLILHRILRL